MSGSESGILQGDTLKRLHDIKESVDLTFFDPPYNQGKNYNGHFDDKQTSKQYWGWVTKVLKGVYEITSDGGCIYFMQREKNAEKVLQTLRKTGWTFQNLIIWKKRTSAVPTGKRFIKLTR